MKTRKLLLATTLALSTAAVFADDTVDVSYTVPGADAINAGSDVILISEGTANLTGKIEFVDLDVNGGAGACVKIKSTNGVLLRSGGDANTATDIILMDYTIPKIQNTLSEEIDPVAVSYLPTVATADSAVGAWSIPAGKVVVDEKPEITIALRNGASLSGNTAGVYSDTIEFSIVANTC